MLLFNFLIFIAIKVRLPAFFIYCLGLLFIACQPDGTPAETASVRTIHLPAPQPLDTAAALDRTVVKKIPLKIPPLHPIGEVSSLLIWRGRCYVVDRFRVPSVYAFDTTGKFLDRLHRPGQGPGEYAQLQSVAINPFAQSLDIYDRGGRKVLRYDLEGNFLDEWPFPWYAKSIQVLDSATYSLHAEDNEWQGEPLHYNWLRVHQGKMSPSEQESGLSRVLGKSFPWIAGIDHIESPGRHVRGQGRLLFSHGWSDTIYQVKEGEISPAYELDFGPSELPNEWRDDPIDPEQNAERLMERLYSPYGKLPFQLAETEDWLSLIYQFEQGQKPHVLIHKPTGQVFPMPVQSEGSPPYRAPMTATRDHFWSVYLNEDSDSLYLLKITPPTLTP